MKSLKSAFLFTLVLILALCFTLAVACGDDDDDDDRGGDYTPQGDDDDLADDDSDDDVLPSNEVWTDPTTNLMWQNDEEAGLNFEEANIYCENLDCGEYDDWRLPTISELRSLIRGCPATETGGSCGVSDDCTDSACWNDACEGCDPDSNGDPNWPDNLIGDGWMYWSTSEVENSIFNVLHLWSIAFRGGSVVVIPFDSADPAYYVRCVR